MKILVIGGSKGIGRETVLRGAAHGHQMRAFSRHGSDTLPEGAEDYLGDACDPAQIEAALEGVDVVINCLGVPKAPSMIWREVTLFSESTAVLLPAMDRAAIRRLIVVTGFGAGQSKSAMSFPERTGHWMLLGRPYADKDRQEAMVRDSGLDWTIVQPVILTNGAYTGRIGVHASPEKWRNGLISRADVAGYVIDAAETGRDLHQAVVLRREG